MRHNKCSTCNIDWSIISSSPSLKCFSQPFLAAQFQDFVCASDHIANITEGPIPCLNKLQQGTGKPWHELRACTVTACVKFQGAERDKTWTGCSLCQKQKNKPHEIPKNHLFSVTKEPLVFLSHIELFINHPVFWVVKPPAKYS